MESDGNSYGNRDFLMLFEEKADPRAEWLNNEDTSFMVISRNEHSLCNSGGSVTILAEFRHVWCGKPYSAGAFFKTLCLARALERAKQPVGVG